MGSVLLVLHQQPACSELQPFWGGIQIVFKYFLQQINYTGNVRQISLNPKDILYAKDRFFMISLLRCVALLCCFVYTISASYSGRL